MWMVRLSGEQWQDAASEQATLKLKSASQEYSSFLPNDPCVGHFGTTAAWLATSTVASTEIPTAKSVTRKWTVQRGWIEQVCLLLSTRAGGLSQLSDCRYCDSRRLESQVDLQAMDRGTVSVKKPVQVFRFVTEGTVEEKIIERATASSFSILLLSSGTTRKTSDGVISCKWFVLVLIRS
jgi:hypothetical protein